MISNSHLKTIAALIWYAGSLFVTAKAIVLTKGALELFESGFQWHWLAAALGIVLGLLKAAFILSKSSRRNIERIANLDNPRWWNVYPLWFYPLLGLMILSGRLMTHFSSGLYPWICVVVTAYFMIGIGLGLGGIPFFLKNQAVKG